jgi:oxygen-independent coproporphyrinogen-3 oxidase
MESRQPTKTELVSLDASILMADAIIFGLRMNAGIDLAEIALRFPAPEVMAMLEPLLARFEAEGLLIRGGAHARLTHKGRLVCDAIGSAVLEAVV